MQYSKKIILGKYRAHVVFSLRKQSTFTMYEIFIGRCRKMQQNYMKPFRRKLWLYCHVLSLSDVELRIPSCRKIYFYEKDAEISLFGQIWWSSIFIFWIFLNIYEIERNNANQMLDIFRYDFLVLFLEFPGYPKIQKFLAHLIKILTGYEKPL